MTANVEFNDRVFQCDEVKTNTLRDRISHINKGLSIVTLATKMGVRIEEKESGEFTHRSLCFHKGDKSASLCMSSITNSWYAFCCSIGGTVVNFMQWALECRGLPHAPSDAVAQIESIVSSQEMEQAFQKQLIEHKDNRNSFACFLYLGVNIRRFLEAFNGHPTYEQQKTKCDQFFYTIDKSYPDPLLVDYSIASSLYQNTLLELSNEARNHGIKINFLRWII